MPRSIDHTAWRRLKKLYFATSALKPRERRKILEQQCPRTDPLRAELERLLRVNWVDVEEKTLRADAPDHRRKAPNVTMMAATNGVSRPVRRRTRSTSAIDPTALLAHSAADLGRWGTLRLIEEIGQGSFGTVYRAFDPQLERAVAVKLLRPTKASAAQVTSRLLLEARALARVHHSNVVRVYEAGAHDGCFGLAMELVAGVTLKQMLEAHGPFSAGEARLVGYELCGALAAVHHQNLIHGDVKAQNVMREVGGRLVLMDFGAGRERHPPKKATPQSIGTPFYLAPEVLAGESATVSSDIYSLGVLLYHLVTGDFPIRASSQLELRLAHTRREITAAQDLRPELPMSFVRIIERATHRDPAKRFPNALRMAAALASISGSHGAMTDVPRLRAPEPRARRPRAADAREFSSVAVLPFTDMSPAKDQECFCNGMTDELINALTQVSGLRVAARTSAFQFQGQARDVRRIGRVLKVATVVDGSVRTDGKRLRVTVEMIGSVDGYQLWSQSFDRNLVDVFAVQDEIARAVVAKLKGTWKQDGTVLIQPGRNLDAYWLYLEGRYHWGKRTEEELSKSVECFEQAIEHDSNYAQAHVALADSYITLGTYGALPSDVVVSGARRALTRAFEIDAGLAEAYTCRGCLSSVYDWAWSKAEQDFRRAIEMKPSYSTAHHWFAMNHLVPLGRFTEATDALHCALNLDPLALAIKTSVGMKCYFARQFDDAVRELTKAIELDGSFGVARLFLGATYTELGKYPEARRELEAALRCWGRRPEVLAALGYCCGRSGDRDGARRVLLELTKLAANRYVSAVRLAQVHAGLGERREAIRQLEKACAERAAELAWLNVRPVFDSLRKEPGFLSVIAQLHLRH